MKTYQWFFIVISLAQIVFALTWFLVRKEIDKVIVISLIIYGGAMVIGYIAYEVEK